MTLTPVVDAFWICQFDLQVSIACCLPKSIGFHNYQLSGLNPFNLSAFGSDVTLSTLDAFVTSGYPRLATW